MWKYFIKLIEIFGNFDNYLYGSWKRYFKIYDNFSNTNIKLSLEDTILMQFSSVKFTFLKRQLYKIQFF